MKLKNKKTGEIAEPFGITCINGRTFVQFDDGKGTFKFEAHSLAELNEEWEDYEEPKGYWCIDCFSPDGLISKFSGSSSDILENRKSIGNYFETKEEAEKAVEKLKAWKRLKDKGFRFGHWVTVREKKCGKVEFKCDDIWLTFDEAQKFYKDITLLFGGE